MEKKPFQKPDLEKIRALLKTPRERTRAGNLYREREAKEASRVRIKEALSDPRLNLYGKIYILAIENHYSLRSRKDRKTGKTGYLLLDKENLRTVVGENYSFSVEDIFEFLTGTVSHEELHSDTGSEYDY